jgi:hypothetical protein
MLRDLDELEARIVLLRHTAHAGGASNEIRAAVAQVEDAIATLRAIYSNQQCVTIPFTVAKLEVGVPEQLKPGVVPTVKVPLSAA